MKKIIKTIITCIFAGMMLISCGESASYRNDVSVADISSSYIPLIENGSSLTEMTADYISSSMKLPIDKCSEYSVYLPAAGATFDEFGIFKATSEEDVGAIKTAVEEYIARRANDELALKYIEEDAPNVTGAEVKVAGLYVTYAMLNDEESMDVYNAFDAALKQE